MAVSDSKTKNFHWTISLIWSASRGWTIAWAVLLAAQGLLPGAVVWMSRLFVDGLVQAVQSNGSSQGIVPLLPSGAALFGVLVLLEILQSAATWVHTAQAEYVQDYINGLVQQKSSEVDLAFYESPEYHDHLHRARDDASSRPLALLESLGGLLQNGLTMLAMAAVLIPYRWWLPLLLIVSTIPALYVVARSEFRYHAWWQRSTADQRRTWYYEWLLTGADVAAELRLFGLGAHFQAAHAKLRRQLRSERLALLRAQSIRHLATSLLAQLIAGAAVAWMAWQAIQGQVTLGDLTLFYAAFSRGQNLLHILLADAGRLYSNSLFLGNLFEFLALEPKITEPSDPVPLPSVIQHGLQFRSIRFCYPGSQHPALEDFDLQVPAGQTVAIVGSNGAGKSTLLKLLCRFYDADAGSIELDGVDIRHFGLAELRRNLSVLFQAPVQYQATAAENIVLGDIDKEYDAGALEAAAQAAGARVLIGRLPYGYDTQLGKWFANGVELSGGEWQRVALARAFLRKAQIILLDEPTSAMDSWSEADWFARLRTLAQGRITIIITHRFTIAMRADVIHVMDQGRIIESGSHDELLAQGGTYAEGWAVQMRRTPVEDLVMKSSGL